MPPLTRENRNHFMMIDRARGATIRGLAARYGLSKSQAHRIVSHVELLPPPDVVTLVPTAEGFVYRITRPRGRAYRIRAGRRVAT